MAREDKDTSADDKKQDAAFEELRQEAEKLVKSCAALEKKIKAAMKDLKPK